MNVGAFAESCVALCGAFNASEVAGYQTAARLRARGGCSSTLHLVGLARYVELDDRAELDAFVELAGKLGIHVVDAGDFLHLTPAR